MKISEIEELWDKSFKELLNFNFNGQIISVLSKQTVDSIRRIEIYKTYRVKSQQADNLGLEYFHTSNPFILAQRSSLLPKQRVWIIYLATYFGKSNKSNWNLFQRSAFDKNKNLFIIDDILEKKNYYYDYLESFDFFNNSAYSNHRKYTKKSLKGINGVFHSMDYFLDNISNFVFSEYRTFDEVYKLSHNIPNFGRMAAFDFTASLAKCELNVMEPKSLYLHGSSGPIDGLNKLLKISNNNTIINNYEFGDDLLKWFVENSEIKFIAQVLEDAICNWQKSPLTYKKYFG